MNQEIKNEAIAVFEQYPTAQKVFVTPDCQAFLKEDRARMHNKDYETVKRSDVMLSEDNEKKENKAKEGKKSAEELITFAATATIEEIDVIVNAGEKRATVLAAFDARKLELTNPE